MYKIILKTLALPGIVALALSSGAGCKNVCEKATDHMLGCMEDWCNDQDSENPACEAMGSSEARDAALAHMGECEGPTKAGSEILLDMDCDALLEQYGTPGG